VRQRHAAHYLALAEAQSELIDRLGVGAASLQRLDLERENLLRALETCDREGDPAAAGTGLRLVVALRHYWAARGWLALGLRVTMTALQRAAGRPVDQRHLVALIAATQMQWWSGHADEALRLARELDIAAQALGDRRSAVFVHTQIGDIMEAQGRLDEAEQAFAAAHALAQALADDKLRADALGKLGWLARSRGQASQAAPLFDEVLAIRRRSGHGYRIAVALLGCADTAIALGDAGRARAWLQEAALLMRQVGNHMLDMYLTDISAALLAQRAQWHDAVVLAAAAAVQRRTLGMQRHPADEPAHEAAMRQARQALGDGSFEQAWAQGAALGHAPALAWVAQVLDLEQAQTVLGGPAAGAGREPVKS
jgi:ATP/maltotriose-dependent transcriptional regulator MalT